MDGGPDNGKNCVIEAERELQVFFDLHLKSRILAGIPDFTARFSPKAVLRPAFEIQALPKHSWVFKERQGLIDLLLKYSGIGEDVIENRFPKGKSYFRNGEFYPRALLYNRVLPIGVEYLLSGEISAVCDSSEGLVSIIPIELISLNNSSTNSLMVFLGEQKNLRFMATKELVSAGRVLADPDFIEGLEKFESKLNIDGAFTAASNIQEGKKGGPYSNGSAAAKVAHFGKRLSKWEAETASQPHLKLCRSDFVEVMVRCFGFTQTMAKNIWCDRPDVGRWSDRGAPSHKTVYISEAEIEHRFMI